MAEDFRYQVQQLQQKQPANKTCIDCSAPNPQWASVSFGTFFCLECSGLHRSLGVHISFVRSVSMDFWKEEQYKKMLNGGNDKARQFFEKYGIQQLAIVQKYNTPAADLYKQKLLADVEGKALELPQPSAELSKPKVAQAPQPTQKAQNEEFFAQKGSINDSRPADIPPSQGGKYQGFGSQYEPPQKEAEPDVFASIAKGFSLFGAKAVKYGKLAADQAQTYGKEINEKVIQPTSQKLQDPALRQNLQTGFQNFGKQVAQTSDKGLQFIQSAINGEPLSPNSQKPTSFEVPESEKSAPLQANQSQDNEEEVVVVNEEEKEVKQVQDTKAQPKSDNAWNDDDEEDWAKF